PAYMAPEQMDGGVVGPAADLYALGVVLYELVTGKLPFAGETRFETAMKRLHEPPPSPRMHRPDLGPAWEAAILRCLERDPAARSPLGLPLALPPAIAGWSAARTGEENEDPSSWNPGCPDVPHRHRGRLRHRRRLAGIQRPARPPRGEPRRLDPRRPARRRLQ